MNVYWLEQIEADLPEVDNWLSPDEKARLAAMRFPRRRADWRLGRWTAKQTLAICLNLPDDPESLASIEIRSAASGAPQAFVDAEPSGMAISLSHRAGVALCAIASWDARLGCDLETIEPRSDAFLTDYFTDEEQALVRATRAADRPRALTLLWSAKESALKALQAGLRLDTRSITVSLEGDAFRADDWSPLRARYSDDQVFYGWWRSDKNLVRTMVCNTPAPKLVRLSVPAHSGNGGFRSQGDEPGLAVTWTSAGHHGRRVGSRLCCR